MEEWYKKYTENESLLIEDIENDKISYLGVVERCDKLFELIPSDVSLNPFGLYKLIAEKYANDIDYQNCKQTKYIINVADIDEADIEEYIQNVANKFKKS